MKKRRKRSSPNNVPSLTNYYVTAKTPTQSEYLCSIDKNDITIADGSAGTGKTYLAVAKACQFLEEGKVKQIILTRPLVDSEHGALGILPGTIEDKFDPYILPMRSLLNQFLGASKVDSYIKGGKIVGIPLALARGLTFDNSFVIASEFQNATPVTAKLLLTRLGTYSTLVMEGDSLQVDIKGPSGLSDVQKRLANLSGVGFITFCPEDCVRSPIVKAILKRYEDSS